MTFWVPTHAPQSLVTRLGSVSTFLSYHAHGSPLDVALSWVVSIPGSPSGGVGTSRVRLLPTGSRSMALKKPFLVIVLSYQGPRLPHGVAPSTVFPTHGHRGLTPSISLLGYVFSWQRLILAMSLLGDASLRRCLCSAMPLLGDVFLGRCLSWAMPLLGDVFARRCLSWAMSFLGDASLRRYLSWEMPLLGDASLGRCLTT